MLSRFFFLLVNYNRENDTHFQLYSMNNVRVVAQKRKNLSDDHPTLYNAKVSFFNQNV